MNLMMKKSNLVVSSLFLYCIFCITSCEEAVEKQSRVDTLPFYDEATFTPQWLSPEDATLESFHHISPFQLVNQNGEAVTEKTFD